MNPPMTRRRLLVRGGAAIGTLSLVKFATACGDDDTAASTSTTAAAAADSTGATTTAATGLAFGTLAYALNWVNDVSSAGAFIAETRGYYVDAGFDGVDFTPGGPNAAAPETSVSGNSVLIATSSPTTTAAANAAGTDLTVIGAQLQKSPLCILSSADSPITTPEELIGKTIGIADGLSVPWETFLAGNGIDPSAVPVAPASYDPTPLTTGEWDGYLAYATNEPVSLELAGFPVEVLLWADYGYDLVTQTYLVRTPDLTERRDEIKAVLMADIRGWRDNVADPDYGATLVVDDYGSDLGLTLEHQGMVNRNQIALMRTADTDANGLFTLTAERIEAAVSTMAAAGTEVDPDVLFDLSLLEEIYAEHPELKEPV